MRTVFEWLRRPLVQALVAAILVVAALQASEHVEALERKAAAAERQAAEVAEGARAAAEMARRVSDMEGTLPVSEDLPALAERLAASEKIAVASSQSGGTAGGEKYSDLVYRFRVQNVTQAPLIRFLKAMEASQNGLVVRDLTIRKSIQNPKRLDSEFEVALMIPADPGGAGQ